MNKIRENLSNWSVEKRAKLLSEIFEKKMKRKLDLKTPRTFSEMIQWVKLFYHDPNMTRCADKVTFKDYVASVLGGDDYTAKIYKVWCSPEEVSLSDVPVPCVVKSNCSSDGNNILLFTDKDKIDIAAEERNIKEHWFDRLGLHTNSFASYYYDVQPKVIVEQYLAEAEGADDYDVLCFHGEPRLVYSKTEHFIEGQNQEDGYPISFYTLDWKYIDVCSEGYTTSANIKRPPHLGEMLELSRKLSKGFPFVRVDFYENPKKLYVAEFSFSPCGGMRRYTPESFDFKMGEWLDILHTANSQYIDEFVKK